MKLDYRPDIDGLRAIAVISVLLFHLNLPVRAGYLGVDIFFVISGFLITRNILSEVSAGTFTLKKFYLARLRRIAPALIATLILTFAAGMVILSPGALQDLSGSCLAAIASASNFFFYASSGYFDSDSHTKPLLHTWSLGVEEQFYVIWPLLLLSILRRTTATKTRLVVAMVFLASLTAAQYMLRRDEAAAFFMLPFRAFELAGGALVAFFPAQKSKSWFAEILVGVGILAIIASVLIMNESTPMPGVLSLIPCCAAGLIIYFGAASRIVSRVLTNGAAVFVGRISYSLYLVHWPIVVFAEYLIMRRISGWEIVACGALSLATAYVLYAFVEQPFRRRTAGSPVVSARRLIASVAAGVCVLVPAAASAFWHAGWPWRIRGLAVATSIGEPRQFHVAYFGGRHCGGFRCETRKNGDPIYVLGDSHATALFEGLTRNYPDQRFVLFIANACPIFAVDYTHNDAHTAQCDKAQAAAIKEIGVGQSPVLVTSHWAARMASRYFSKGRERSFSSKDTAAFVDFVNEELAKLGKKLGDRRIIVLGGVPRYQAPLSPLDCLTRPFGNETCMTSNMKSPFIAEQEAINDRFRKTRQSREFLDPYDYLCQKGVCRNITLDGMPIYSDVTHLSIWGSTYLIGRMKPDLDRMLFNAPPLSN